MLGNLTQPVSSAELPSLPVSRASGTMRQSGLSVPFFFITRVSHQCLAWSLTTDYFSSFFFIFCYLFFCCGVDTGVGHPITAEPSCLSVHTPTLDIGAVHPIDLSFVLAEPGASPSQRGRAGHSWRRLRCHFCVSPLRLLCGSLFRLSPSSRRASHPHLL